MAPEGPDDPPKKNEPVTNGNAANKLGDAFTPSAGTPTGPNGYNVGEVPTAGTGGIIVSPTAKSTKKGNQTNLNTSTISSNPLSITTFNGGSREIPSTTVFEMEVTSIGASAGINIAGASSNIVKYVWPKNPNNIHTFKGDYHLTFLEINIEGGSSGTGASLMQYWGTTYNVNPYTDFRSMVENNNKNWDAQFGLGNTPLLIGASYGITNDSPYQFHGIGVGWAKEPVGLMKHIPSTTIPNFKTGGKTLSSTLGQGVYRILIPSLSSPTPNVADSMDFAEGRVDTISLALSRRRHQFDIIFKK